MKKVMQNIDKSTEMVELKNTDQNKVYALVATFEDDALKYDTVEIYKLSYIPNGKWGFCSIENSYDVWETYNNFENALHDAETTEEIWEFENSDEFLDWALKVKKGLI